MNSKMNIATLNLFNAIQVGGENVSFNSAMFARMIKSGIVCQSNINLTSKLVNEIESIMGIGAEKVNSSFHKSWSKVATAPYYQLLIEQLLHYFTTYGFESIGIYDENSVYIPKEVFDIPEITEDIKFAYIRGLTSVEILSKIIQIGSTGIALSESTLDYIMTIVKENEYDSDFVSLIANRELQTLLQDYYHIVPEEPVAFLRFVITKLTGESLLIKNHSLIEKIKSSDGNVLDELMEYAPENLSSIFYRFKPLFLAMKSVSSNKTFFNRLRKSADFTHVPMPIDYLNNVTNEISNGTFSIKELKVALTRYPIWRKIRLAYALNNRTSDIDSIVYRIRNGKGWVEDFKGSAKKAKFETVLSFVLDSIAKDISENVNGKVFYIPSYIHYTLPATEKQFVGNFPTNTWVSAGENLVVGIHWYNVDGHRIDIDLSAIDIDGKYGWDGMYRSSSRDVLFSGDVTDASLPDGATELFYFSKSIPKDKLLVANYFNFVSEVEVPCQLIVANEKVDKRFESRNYMVNPSNILVRQNVTINKKQNTIGLIANVDGENRVYFSQSGIGESISVRNASMTEKIRNFLSKTAMNSIELSDVLFLAGAKIVTEIPEEGEYVNLSPESLDKNTIIDILKPLTEN